MPSGQTGFPSVYRIHPGLAFEPGALAVREGSVACVSSCCLGHWTLAA